LDQLPGLKKEQVLNHEVLAQHIAQHGSDSGFDWAVARSFTTDHAFSIPYKLIVRRAEEISGRSITAIPVYLASAVDPFITKTRARQLGEQIRAAVESFESDEQLFVIGSGGISHWVGLKETGKVNEAFDHQVIDLCCNADIDGLAAYTDEQVLENGGNGAMEIRNFICAMAAANASHGELIEYQPVPEWVTGLGFIELKKG
jgi:protocatechuate 4,5-dioxygenase beta chain